MFYVLCLALCLAVWFIVLAGLSMLCQWGARLFGPLVSSSAPARAANRLFAVRVLPLFLACVVTLGFALPAFMEFEPRATGEMMSVRLFVLGALGALALIAMAIRAAKTVRATTLVREEWRSHSKKLCVEGMDVPVYCLDGPRSVMAVLGIFRPEIFVSREVTQVLSAEELSAAIAHERAHVRSFDNLKQILLKVTRLPRWLKPNTFGLTDMAWINVSEVAADEAALAAGASPLDLSAALVKVARLTRRPVMSEAVAASHLLPVACGSAIQARMSHLQELLEDTAPASGTKRQGRKYPALLFLVLFTITYVACVNAALPWVHEALESLVR
jgi:Zn-dependent protease with chaperone function